MNQYALIEIEFRLRGVDAPVVSFSPGLAMFLSIPLLTLIYYRSV